MCIVDAPTRYLFFTGKGGVGKTSLSCAVAVSLADRGKRTLLISTDPASNLDQVLNTRLSRQPQPVPGVENLEALNIDPEAAAQAYRDRVMTPYKKMLPQDALEAMEEQMSGACTVEVAAFDEFTLFLADDEATAAYDHVIFDTAPTGHTLRLLELPASWSDFLATNTSGTSCLGPTSGLQSSRDRYEKAVATLRDGEITTLMMVSRPEPSSLQEAARSAHELSALGIVNQHLLINGLFTASVREDAVAVALEERGTQALAGMPEALRSLPSTRIPMQGRNLVGLEALRALCATEESDFDHASAHLDGDESAGVTSVASLPLESMIEELMAQGHGLVMFMGKGGVGKTTMAQAVAVALAQRGADVHLSTTDPAAHLEERLGATLPTLQISRIDPHGETESYVNRVLDTAGSGLDQDGRALLEEDLRSPCTEEVAVFHAFSRLVDEAKQRFVVLDTAPTGHTLLLLDATGAYHREVMKSDRDAKQEGSETPLMLLRNGSHTRVVIVTLAETTPVQEAAQLQEDLRRAEIEPFAWVINASLAASGSGDPTLRRRADSERQQMQTIR
ncbi:MAG: arsenical pump-driving ATPase, partial [Magnetococcales bacterium]|nr:arsenical pump-driving ATPase [Magnetococcales bacterium]